MPVDGAGSVLRLPTLWGGRGAVPGEGPEPRVPGTTAAAASVSGGAAPQPGGPGLGPPPPGRTGIPCVRGCA